MFRNLYSEMHLLIMISKGEGQININFTYISIPRQNMIEIMLFKFEMFISKLQAGCL